MPLPPSHKKRIEQLKATMPKAPVRDGVVGHAGQARGEIAALYERAGDEMSAMAWYLEAATFSEASADFIGAIAWVKRGLRLRPNHSDAVALYLRLWKVMGLGDMPDPVT